VGQEAHTTAGQETGATTGLEIGAAAGLEIGAAAGLEIGAAAGLEWLRKNWLSGVQLPKNHPSGAKARKYFARFMYGLKPVPFS
jgi:hypothetical protein